MSVAELPRFTYHPDPVATGSVEPSEEPCVACGRRRGFLCTDVPAGGDLPDDGGLCPWCVADGTAHRRFDVSFADLDPGTPPDVREEVEHRTVGYVAWQTERWLVHCGDACEFHGLPAQGELRHHPDAWQMIRDEIAEYPRGLTGEELDAFVDGLGPEYDSTAYLFRCRHCNRWLAFWDAS